MGSKRFKFNKADGLHILKVFAWTVASAVIAGLVSLLQVVEFPQELLWLIPTINTLLVAGKKFVDNNKNN